MRPKVVSIAGFDSSGGAGILSDIKTFEANQVYGFGVCSALTFQNDVYFEKVNWITVEDIIRQIEVLQQKHTFNFIKIGIIENINILNQIIQHLKSNLPDSKIIWDPILKASAGYIFHSHLDRKKLFELCNHLYLITPNKEEMKVLFPELEEEKAAEVLSHYCPVLLKSGKQDKKHITDFLFKKGETTAISGNKTGNEKHGTGCIMSSAILSFIAKGYTLEDACRKAKKYVEKFRLSNGTNLGYHLAHE